MQEIATVNLRKELRIFSVVSCDRPSMLSGSQAMPQHISSVLAGAQRNPS
jgi:hypothetical protein